LFHDAARDEVDFPCDEPRRAAVIILKGIPTDWHTTTTAMATSRGGSIGRRPSK
jgi:hypothetical protein